MVTVSPPHRLFVLSLMMSLWVVLLMPDRGRAQGSQVQAWLSCFKEIHRVDPTAVTRPYECQTGAVPLEVVVRSPGTFGPEVVQTLLDELVKVGLTTDSDPVQIAVCQALHGASRVRDGEGGPLVPNTVPRLEELFFSGRPVLREFCIGIARNKADGPGMIEFLKRVVSEVDAPDAKATSPASYGAVEQLEALGAAGLSALRELAGGDRIPHPRARWLAERALDRCPYDRWRY
ncbi:hypothetical protein BH23GEM11_BH23GEM11_06790 [soil metagenome]